MAKYYTSKADYILQFLINEKARAKDEMLAAACVADVNTVLMRAGEQTAFDVCIKKVGEIFKHSTSLPISEQNVQECDATEADQGTEAGTITPTP